MDSEQHLPSSLSLNESTLRSLGIGTNRFDLTNLALLSTLPFSYPE